jgi:hypothetical protein
MMRKCAGLQRDDGWLLSRVSVSVLSYRLQQLEGKIEGKEAEVQELEESFIQALISQQQAVLKTMSGVQIIE